MDALLSPEARELINVVGFSLAAVLVIAIAAICLKPRGTM